MNPETTKEQPPGPILTASELLRQWNEMVDKRKTHPRATCIEEAVDIAHGDLFTLGWFLDKTLKLLAARESESKEKGKS